MAESDGKKRGSDGTVEDSHEPRSFRAESTEDFTPEWCQEILNDPSWKRTSMSTRKLGGPQGPKLNSLLAKTLFTDNTIRAVQTFYRPKEAANGVGGEVVALLSLGDEICSHVNVLHGGMNAMLVGEIGAHLAMQEFPGDIMAANMNVNLRKSVKIPGIVVGRAWMERPPEGRKVWVKIRLEQDGVTCIEAENLYLKVHHLRGKM